jgi:hypothetical protein
MALQPSEVTMTGTAAALEALPLKRPLIDPALLAATESSPD